MPRPILATIHTAALRHNLQRAHQAAQNSRVWAIVKANAYGHGIERVFEGFRGADGFGLLDLDEAVRVRQLGWRGPILLLEGVFEQRDLELCSRLGLWHTVHCDEQIQMLATHKTEMAHRVFLKMNSGMNRLGFTPQQYRAAWTRLNALPQVEEISLMTHFSDADSTKGIAPQMKVFNEAARDLPGERSVCNSAATLRYAGLDEGGWVRPGIALYGSAPDFPANDSAHWDLRPGMTLSSKIIATQSINTADTVGYGSTFMADKPMVIGVVACGYADGYPRHCSTDTPVPERLGTEIQPPFMQPARPQMQRIFGRDAHRAVHGVRNRRHTWHGGAGSCFSERGMQCRRRLGQSGLRAHFSGQHRGLSQLGNLAYVLLHCLELADRAAELDSFVRVSHRHIKHFVKRASQHGSPEHRAGFVAW